MPPRADMTRSGRHTPLSDYVQAYMDREGLSANKLATRSRDPETGQRILVQWLINLKDAQLTDKAPEMWRLRALAAGMSTSDDGGLDRERFREQLEVVKRLTAAQWLEMTEVLDVETSDGSIVTVSVPPDLSPEAREKIRAWAEQMARDLSNLG
jgi:hypothetical protein